MSEPLRELETPRPGRAPALAEPPQAFDAIVVGSGIGGLTAASLLARVAGYRVLVLEQHYRPGGFTHEFTRPGGRHWDVGVHYLGELGPGALGRQIFDFVSEGALRWQRMPEPFERYVYPGLTFAVHGEPAQFRSELVERFPGERDAIESYFGDLRRAAGWGRVALLSGLLPKPLGAALRRLPLPGRALALQRTSDYLQARFRDPRLRALVASRWKDLGLPPSESAFLGHAVIEQHYLRGGWYPVGGASAFARHIIPVIERRGGRVLTRRRVTQLRVTKARVTTVEAVCRRGGRDQREEYTAPIVISDAGAVNTFGHLLSTPEVAAIREELSSVPPGPSGICLYVALARSAASIGVRGENYWISESYHHDREAEGESALAGRPSACYLSFPSLKDPTSRIHTAEILVLAEYDVFKPWADRPWHERGPEYEALKARVAEGMLALVERHLPGFRELVVSSELSTPLSVEHFAASPKGAIYGLPSTPERFRRGWCGARTPLRNLFLAGADVYVHGVLGAAMGGVAAAGAALGPGPLGFVRLLRRLEGQGRGRG